LLLQEIRRMKTNVKEETKRLAFMRFGLSGLVFTVLGPTIFWIAYPLGPLVALAVAELNVHSLRFLVFRNFVFPAKKGYQVNLTRYIVSALPVALGSAAIIMLLSHWLDRTKLTLAGASFSLVLGFIWSRLIYTKPIMYRRHAKKPKSPGNI